MTTNQLPAFAEGRNYKIALLMDDDPFSLNLAQIALEESGVSNVITAEDGQTGIRLFDQMSVKPDLIVCDLYMPVMDGIEVLNELGNRNYAGGVILVTAGDLTIMEIATKLALRGSKLKLLGAFPKPLSSACICNALGLT